LSNIITKKKEELADLIRNIGIVIKDVTLSSGEKSNFYYDIKSVVLDPKGGYLIGKLVIDMISNFNVKSIGGLELGAIPIATIIARESYGNSKDLKAFFVRKSAKKHGLEKEIEGNIVDPVVIVDDVITTGKSVLQTIEKISKRNLKISCIICVLDREQGAEKLFKEHNIAFYPLFKHSHFKEYIDKKLNEKRTIHHKKQSNKLEVQSVSH
jgi:orotate phosphoribosyltransferase